MCDHVNIVLPNIRPLITARALKEGVCLHESF